MQLTPKAVHALFFEDLYSQLSPIEQEAMKKAGLPHLAQQSRYEVKVDSMGKWLHDNQTGLDYSCEIGLHLANECPEAIKNEIRETLSSDLDIGFI